MRFNIKAYKGFTLIELVVTVAILAILASSALPMVQMSVQRNKENQLRTNLRQIRLALDAYKLATDEGRIKKNIDESGYPPNLSSLVQGVKDEKSADDTKIKFLRNIPLDPMTRVDDDLLANNNEPISNWGLRSYKSDATNPVSGEDVYDIYSKSEQIGINGVPYAQW